MSRRPGVPFAKGRKVCIFCGGTPVTEEHIWPQWSQPVLPKSEGHRRFIFTGRRSRPTANIKKLYDRQGSVFTVRIRRVCGPCNSGWMNDYEQTVRTVVTRMMIGKRVLLAPASARTLAEYLTYKCMVIDWSDDDNLLPREANHRFYTDREIPPFTSIHLFHCFEGPWRSAMRSHHFAVCRAEDFTGPDMPKNTKSFAVGLGDLFVLLTFSTQLDLGMEFERNVAVRLWPPTVELGLSWPPRYPIDSQQAEYISRTTERIGDSPNVIDLG